MSKNFELMQEAFREMERESPPAPETGPILFPGIGEATKTSEVSAEFDAVAQEECLRLVQRLFLSQASNAYRVVVFAGIDRGSGCSRVCLESARILASNTSSRVCVVDANFRTPALSDFCEMPNHHGLADCLAQDGSIGTFAKRVRSSNLWLLSAGALTGSSPALLNSDRLKHRVQELRDEYQYILIDVPALNLHTDAVAVGQVSDGVVLVLHADSTRRESALRGIQSLRDARVEVLGAVLNRRTFPIPEFVYRRL